MINPSARTAVRAAGFPLVTTLVVTVVHSFSPGLGLLLFVLGLAAVAIWAIVMLGRVVAAAWQRAWRRSALALLTLVAVWPFVGAVFLSGDYAHLALMYPFYVSKIRDAATHQSEQVSFGWGGTGVAGSGNSERSLVYDMSGKLATAIGVRLLPEDPAVSVSTNHLVGNFYIIEMSW